MARAWLTNASRFCVPASAADWPPAAKPAPDVAKRGSPSRRKIVQPQPGDRVVITAESLVVTKCNDLLGIPISYV